MLSDEGRFEVAARSAYARVLNGIGAIGIARFFAGILSSYARTVGECGGMLMMGGKLPEHSKEIVRWQ